MIGLILGAGEVSAAEPPSVVSFSPQGTVKQVRQVTARFSEPMVPLGDPRVKVSPFLIDCAAKGSERWIDSGSWAYDFDKDLPAGVRCSFTLRADLKTLGGAVFGAHPVFAFDTGGPAIIESRPFPADNEIDEQQAFVLVLDAEPDENSVLEHAGFAVQGMPERVGVNLLTGADRDLLLKRFSRFIDKRPVVILTAKQRFPNKSEVRLIWGKGIKTKSGIATDQDQVFNFKTRKDFEAKFQCERESPKAGCIPLTPMSVAFTWPVIAEQARRVALITPDGKRHSPVLSDESEQTTVSFHGPFAESSQFTIEVPPDIVDDSGRRLSNASRFPFTVRTDEYPPLAKFSARFGIIEQADPVLPVTLRNLEAEIRGDKLDVRAAAGQSGSTIHDLLTRITATLWRLPPPDAHTVLVWLRRIGKAKRTQSVFGAAPADGAQSFEMPKPNGANAFEVAGIPLKRPGLYIVELASARLGAVLLGRAARMYVPTAALVTNLSVHFKWGHDNSIVWVTSLEDARPIAAATVAIADCNGAQLWSGVTDRRGIATVPRIEAVDKLPQCPWPEGQNESDYYADQGEALRGLDGGLIVTARYGSDFSFVHSSWTFGLESWRFQLPSEWRPSPFVAHTVLDRALFRAGETVHMKHFIRDRTLQGFALTKPVNLPQTLSIRLAGGEQNYQFKLTWNANGTAETTWKIPKDAKLGEYDLIMIRQNQRAAAPTPGPESEENATAEVQSGSFRVEEFRIPLMKAAVRLPAATQVSVTRLPVDVSVEYLSGGAAKGLPVILRSQIIPNASVRFPDFENFAFADGAVKEGVVKNEEWYEGGEIQAPSGVHQRKDLVLDGAGGAQTEITDIPVRATPVEVRAELEYRDPNGESQTVSNSITIWPAKRLAGIQVDDWSSSRGAARVHVAVVGEAGKPAAGAPVKVELFTSKMYSYRKRLVGGFYAYENIHETRKAGELCSGVTDRRGLFSCDAKPSITGEASIQASVADDSGHTSFAYTEIFIPGPERYLFPGHDDDRMDLLPEKPRYEPGEQARFQVRMPFGEATALVTVEREGILAASVIRLSGKDPVITLPVRDYAPNVFVSVMAVRGRIGSVQPTAMVDLGKPSFKLGIAEIRVGWRDHELKVAVTPDRAVYHVREKAVVKIAVKTANGAPLAPGSEAAIAAVDEGLLQLAPNESWKLLDAMMERRSYQVETSTAQMEVVGKRHYGLKAIPPGGGGGRQITRELFNTLLLWRAVVKLDARGEATVEVPLNDSLTSFRIVAIASGGVGLFGTGSALIRSTQDLMLFAGVSPIIRTGDRFDAEFTVRNASQKALDADVSAKIDGIAQQQPSQKLQLGPGEGKSIEWKVTVPANAVELKYHVDASAQHGVSDHLLITQHVLKTVPTRTYQATLMRWEKPIAQPIARPADALAGEGGIDVALSPSLVAGLDGVRDWMRDYPYICLEQRVSRAVALKDPALWSGVIEDLPSYIDSAGLLKYFPRGSEGSDVLTSYVFSITHEAGLAVPEQYQSKLVEGLRGFVEGKIRRYGDVPGVDLPLRKLAAIEALSRVGQADAGLLSTITIEPNLWPDSAMIDWWNTLLRVQSVPNRQRRLDEAGQIMRARLNWQGTGAHLSGGDLWWLMTGPEGNQLRLALLLLDNNLWHDDVARVMTGAMAMQSRGKWLTTVANAWGTLAVDKFAHVFESTPITGTTTASIESATRNWDWGREPKGGSLSFEWPATPSELHVAHSGGGNPWIEIRARAAIPTIAPFSSGYRITRTLTPVEGAHTPGWRRGELVRVRLKIEAQSDMTWVVVNDPIPAGASHLGTGLMRDSAIATSGENQGMNEFMWPSFAERAFDGYRAYYEYVPKGTFEIEYTIRLNQAGTFQLPASRVEALYEPEMFGELPNAPFEVAP